MKIFLSFRRKKLSLKSFTITSGITLYLNKFCIKKKKKINFRFEKMQKYPMEFLLKKYPDPNVLSKYI